MPSQIWKKWVRAQNRSSINSRTALGDNKGQKNNWWARKPNHYTWFLVSSVNKTATIIPGCSLRPRSILWANLPFTICVLTQLADHYSKLHLFRPPLRIQHIAIQILAKKFCERNTRSRCEVCKLIWFPITFTFPHNERFAAVLMAVIQLKYWTIRETLLRKPFSRSCLF